MGSDPQSHLQVMHDLEHEACKKVEAKLRRQLAEADEANKALVGCANEWARQTHELEDKLAEAEQKRNYFRSVSNTQMRLQEEVERQLVEAQATLTAVIGQIQRLQPGGSPPPGGPSILAAWIARETLARIERLEAALQTARDTIQEFYGTLKDRADGILLPGPRPTLAWARYVETAPEMREIDAALAAQPPAITDTHRLALRCELCGRAFAEGQDLRHHQAECDSPDSETLLAWNGWDGTYLNVHDAGRLIRTILSLRAAIDAAMAQPAPKEVLMMSESGDPGGVHA